MALDTATLYADVAREAWSEVNQWARDTEDDSDEPTEVYLYVFADGRWTIDHAQYIQTTNGCISSVPVSLYNGPAELAEDIEANEDWDAIEDAESDEDDSDA